MYLDQPTYAHFHVHIVHVATTTDAGATQATGKAFGLENVISQLETMGGGNEVGMKDVDISYFAAEGKRDLGENMESVEARRRARYQQNSSMKKEPARVLHSIDCIRCATFSANLVRFIMHCHFCNFE